MEEKANAPLDGKRGVGSKASSYLMGWSCTCVAREYALNTASAASSITENRIEGVIMAEGDEARKSRWSNKQEVKFRASPPPCPDDNQLI